MLIQPGDAALNAAEWHTWPAGHGRRPGRGRRTHHLVEHRDRVMANLAERDQWTDGFDARQQRRRLDTVGEWRTAPENR